MAPVTTPSTSAWALLLGMLTCLLIAGHQLPLSPSLAPALAASRAAVPAQRVTALPALQPMAAPASAQQYAIIRALAIPSAAL